MIEPVFHPQARAELEEAALFYEQRVQGLGMAFSDEVQRALHLIVAHPEIGGQYGIGFRCMAVRRFPFSLVYRVREATIYVIAVSHQHRRPGYWKKRAR